MAIQIVVIVVVIDRGDESPAFIPFVGMPIAPCFKWERHYFVEIIDLFRVMRG